MYHRVIHIPWLTVWMATFTFRNHWRMAISQGGGRLPGPTGCRRKLYDWFSWPQDGKKLKRARIRISCHEIMEGRVPTKGGLKGVGPRINPVRQDGAIKGGNLSVRDRLPCQGRAGGDNGRYATNRTS